MATCLKPITMASADVDHSDAADHRQQVNGIRNQGNTCYFNAVIQSLLRTDLLLDELQHHSHQHHQNKNQQQNYAESSDSTLTNVFLRFARDGYYRQQSDEAMRQLLDTFRRQSTRFSGGGQHDSHDCLIHFLNDLRDEERKNWSSTDATALNPSHRMNCPLTTVDKVFGGHLVTDYTCMTCGDQHRSCEPLITISLPVVVGSKEERPPKDICTSSGVRSKVEETSRPLATPMKKTSRKFHRIKTSVKRSFRHFTRQEEIESEYFCQNCQKNAGGGYNGEPTLTSAIKCTLIYNPPAVLVLHIKRFEQVLGRFRKRNDRIRYQELLDLGPYCISSCKRNNPRNQNVWYSLYGVIVHRGSLTRGHYVAYVKVHGGTDAHDVQDTKTFLQTTYLDRDVETTKTERVQTNESLTVRQHEIPNPSPKPSPQPSPGQWYHVSDKDARPLKTPKDALNKEAYLLFYQRIGTPLQTAEETSP